MENEQITSEEIKKISIENTNKMSASDLKKLKEKLLLQENSIREKGREDGLNFAKQIAQQNEVNKTLENQAHAYIEAFNQGLKEGIEIISKESIKNQENSTITK